MWGGCVNDGGWYRSDAASRVSTNQEIRRTGSSFHRARRSDEQSPVPEVSVLRPHITAGVRILQTGHVSEFTREELKETRTKEDGSSNHSSKSQQETLEQRWRNRKLNRPILDLTGGNGPDKIRLQQSGGDLLPVTPHYPAGKGVGIS